MIWRRVETSPLTRGCERGYSGQPLLTVMSYVGQFPGGILSLVFDEVKIEK